MLQDFKPMVGYTVFYRIVALASGVGKTSLGEELVSYLSRKGVKVAVIKHTHEPIIDPESDTGRYWKAGSRVVIVSSPEATLILKEPLGGLEEIAGVMRFYPLVIAEGFRGSKIGKAIAIIDSEEELSHITGEPGLWMIVSHDFTIVEKAKEIGLNALLFKETEALAEEIYKDALSMLHSMLEGKDCRQCGLSSCLELAEKILTGAITPIECPVLTRLSVIVEDKVIPLNPLLVKILGYTIRGALASIEGVPENPREITIKIYLQGISEKH